MNQRKKPTGVRYSKNRKVKQTSSGASHPLGRDARVATSQQLAKAGDYAKALATLWPLYKKTSAEVDASCLSLMQNCREHQWNLEDFEARLTASELQALTAAFERLGAAAKQVLSLKACWRRRLREANDIEGMRFLYRQREPYQDYEYLQDRNAVIAKLHAPFMIDENEGSDYFGVLAQEMSFLANYTALAALTSSDTNFQLGEAFVDLWTSVHMHRSVEILSLGSGSHFWIRWSLEFLGYCLNRAGPQRGCLLFSPMEMFLLPDGQLRPAYDRFIKWAADKSPASKFFADVAKAKKKGKPPSSVIWPEWSATSGEWLRELFSRRDLRECGLEKLRSDPESNPMNYFGLASPSVDRSELLDRTLKLLRDKPSQARQHRAMQLALLNPRRQLIYSYAREYRC